VLNNENPHEKLIGNIKDMRGRIEVKPSDIEGRMVQNPFFNMAYIASKAKGALDWIDGTPLGKTFGDSYVLNRHHIFPKSLLYKPRGHYSGDINEEKMLVNEIANRAFLTRSSNIEIFNKEPSSYLVEIEHKYPGELEKQFIPTESNLWELEHYEDFLFKRRELIATGINELMDSLIKQKPEENFNLLDLIEKGESEYLEFKSTLLWDINEEKQSSMIEKIVAKTLAGFMNTEGGTLLIGVADDGSIYGIEDDLKVIFKHDKDGFQIRVKGIIQKYLGTQFGKYIHMNFETLKDKTVCIIMVEKSHKQVYLKDKGEYKFFIRIGSSTEPLKPPEDSEYIQAHFN